MQAKPDPDREISEEFYKKLEKYGASDKLLKKLKKKKSKKEKDG